MPMSAPTCCTICNRRRCLCKRGEGVPPRLSACKRGYGRKWQKVRARFLLENPLCNHCSSDEHPVAASQVDHIEPHKGNYQLFNDWGNLQSLCHSCHSKKTKSEQQSSQASRIL